jgi:hypothetical protein
MVTLQLHATLGLFYRMISQTSLDRRTMNLASKEKFLPLTVTEHQPSGTGVLWPKHEADYSLHGAQAWEQL